MLRTAMYKPRAVLVNNNGGGTELRGRGGMRAGRAVMEKGRNGGDVPSRPCGFSGMQWDASGHTPGGRVSAYPAAPSRFMASMTDFIACDWRASSVTAEDD